MVCVLWNKASSLLRSTHNVVLCWYSDLISHTHKYTHAHTGHTEHSRVSRLHTHINIYLHQLLCAHSSYLYCTEWIIYWYQNLISTMSFLFKNYSLEKVIYLLIRSYKTRFFLWNTNNAVRNCANKQNTPTHTKHSKKGNTGKW